MAQLGTTAEPIDVNGNTSNGYQFALTALTSLFFMWGFITCLNDILIPHLKSVFSLSYAQAMLIQFCFFGAYFIMSIPAGKIVAKVGYQKGIVIGLLTAAIGCVMFYPAAEYQSYNLFLFALFVLASGITLLQVSANPYVSILGPSQTASSRLTMTQAFNSLGTTVAPFFGAMLIFSAADTVVDAATEAQSVQLPYLLLAGALTVLAIIFAKLNLPVVSYHQEENQSTTQDSAWQHKHLVLGALGIFVYVGAEVGIGSLLINFLALPEIAGLKEADAAHYVAYYWGGAMVGRFIGAAVMQKVEAGKVLAFNASMAMLLVVLAVLSKGTLAMYAILAVGLCNSIMFPTIFSLAIQRLGPCTSQGSGILCLAIVGGALLPLLQGVVADYSGVQASFFIPLICFAYIIFYGLKGSKIPH